MAGLTLAVGAAGVSLLALVGYGAVKLCANTPLFNKITACFKKYFCCCLPNSNIQLRGESNQPSEEDINEPLSQPPKPVASKKPKTPSKPQVPLHRTTPPTHSPNTNHFNNLKPTQPRVAPPHSPPSFVPSPSFPHHPPAQAGRRIVKVHYQSEGGLLADVDSLKERIRTDLREKNIELTESTAVDAHFRIFTKIYTTRPGLGDIACIFAGVNHGAVVYCMPSKDSTHNARPYEKLDTSPYKLSSNHKILTILFDEGDMRNFGSAYLHKCDYNQPHIKKLTRMIRASIPSSPQDG